MTKANLLFIPAWVPDWGIAVAALAATAMFAAAVLGIVRMVLRRMLPKDHDLSHTILQQAGGIAQFALTLLAAQFITPLLPLDRGTDQIIARFLLAAFIILMGWIAIIATGIAINRYVRRFDSDTADNLLARKAITQMHLLKHVIDITICIITAGFALMTFDAVRQFGISLFASAGIAGIAVGFAAKPLLENLVAGVQLAFTQPFRIDDVVVVNGEFGWVEEIRSTYVVIRCWDWRRLVVPLSYIMTNPFENWTRSSSQIIGSVFFNVDFETDVDRIRTRVNEVVRASKLWDGKVIGVAVTDIKEHTMEIRVLVTAADAGKAFDLRCEVREKVMAWLREEYPQALPRRRLDATVADVHGGRPIPQAPQA